MFFYKKTAFGLDMGDNSIKLVEIKKIKNLKGEEKNVLTSFNERSVESGIIVNGEIKNPPAVIKAIKQCVKDAKGSVVDTKTVVASLPETQSYFKIINTPPLKYKENVLEYVKKSIQQNFPLEDGHFYYSWQKNLLGKISITAAPKNIVDSYTDIMEQADLVPVALELEGIAIARTLINEYVNVKEKPQILIDMGASRSSLIAVHKNEIMVILHISLSGNGIRDVIAKAEKISLEDAEKIKISCGLDIKKCPIKIRKTINTIIHSSTNQIESGLSFINRILPVKSDKMYICGGVSQMSKLTSVLSDSLKIKVRHADPLKNIILGKKINLSNEELLKYVTAIGLAIRGVNNNIL